MPTEGKRPGTEELRPLSVSTQEMPHCSICGNKDFESIFKLCGECEAVWYCSKIFQRKHWTSHQVISKAISDLIVKQSKKVENIAVYNSFYTPKQRNQLVNLIGRKSTVNCFLFDINCKILWDTEANVSVISKSYVRQKFPYLKIRELRKILDNTDNFQEIWGNQRKLPYDGWVKVEVFLNNKSQNSVTVHFLVTSENLEYPIFGTNAIEHLSAPYNRDELQHILPRCLPNHSSEVLDPLVHLLQSEKESSISLVKSPKQRIIVPGGTI